MPAIFDAPLAPHHKLIGRWVAAREDAPKLHTRHEARQHIERVFDGAVKAIFKPFDMVELRVVVLTGDQKQPPALAIVCDTIGQLDLGWIEQNNVLTNTLVGHVAPVGWRAAAYRALSETLGIALPVFGYAELLEEVSMYYWDGALDDATARAHLIETFGVDPDHLDEMTLPSEMEARRPDWMTAKAAPLKDMPADLRRALKRLRDAYRALQSFGADRNAWYVEREDALHYLPHLEDASHLGALTIVPCDEFGREVDDIARHGMEYGFDDVAGLCPLTAPDQLDAWFASLQLGVDYLLAAKALIDFDPANPARSS